MVDDLSDDDDEEEEEEKEEEDEEEEEEVERLSEGMPFSLDALGGSSKFSAERELSTTESAGTMQSFGDSFALE